MSLEKNPTTGMGVDLFGPTVEYITQLEEAQSDFCVLKGTIPPGASVPLHSHADVEDFLLLSGSLEALKHDAAGYHWIDIKTGDYVHVPGNARHAWRNIADEPAVSLIITTKKMGRFFQEVGKAITDTPQPVTPEDLEHFAAVSARYGYWNATPEENAAAGLDVSF